MTAPRPSLLLGARRPAARRAPRAAASADPSSDPPSPPPSARDAVRTVLESEAPFLRGKDALSARVTYKSPIEAQWPGVKQMDSTTTQNTMVFSQTVSRDLLVEMSEAGGGVLLKRNKAFCPSPDSVLVRWEARSGPALVEGSSKFTLGGEGTVIMQEDSWETKPRTEEDDAANFFDALGFARARSGGGTGGLLPSIKLAAWEALKSSPAYGGQLTREELDGFTMQMVYAVAGLGASFAVLAGRLAFLGAGAN